LRKGVSIGRSYIDRITSEVVFLKIEVVYEIKGMSVFDKFGSNVGAVSNISLVGDKNKIKEIYVKRGLLKMDLKIPEEFIEEIGSGVVLNVSKNRVISYNNQ